MPLIDILQSSNHRYDNSTSGLSASDVKAALDELAAASGGSAPFYASSFVVGVTTADQVILTMVVPVAVDLPADLTGSVGGADTAATAQTDFDIQKNGSSVGTIRWAAAATAPSFIMASATAFASGDKLKVIGPTTPDSTLADATFTLAGTRT